MHVGHNILPFCLLEKCEHGHNHEQGFQTFTQQMVNAQ
jgi:hypothetical protein